MFPRLSRRFAPFPLAIALAIGVPSLLGAQTLTLSGAPHNFQAPTAANYESGWIISSASIAFSVSSGSTQSWVLEIRSSSTSLGGGKPLSSLAWSRTSSPAGTWTTMSNTFASVQSGTGSGSGNLFFRISPLSWTGDPPTTYSANLEVRLTRISL